ncbi:MAG TPA: NnrU family protein [Candidatus Limnocylindrales bacterium]|nr:NnrU family protein [Candidatus Limnocylindrales bacterium]
MDPVLSVILTLSLFGITHIGMASSYVRGPLVARFGAFTFTMLFSAVATAGFSLLAYNYSVVSTQGPAGFALGSDAVMRWPLIVLSTLGVMLLVGSLFDYPTSAYYLSSAGTKPEPRGLERITRHPFMVGLAMTNIAHALLATRLTGTIFFAGLSAIAILGSMHQDAKLRARNPSLHGPYTEKSSLVPFAAILSGRNRLVLSELRPFGLMLGLLAAYGLRQAHPHIFADGGIYVIGVVVIGAFLLGLQDLRKHLNRRSVEEPATAHTVAPKAGN